MNEATGSIEQGPIPSGEWAGYWVQEERHRQRMTLDFRDGRVRGEGDDEVGRFRVTGDYRLDDGVVTWVKSYVGAHAVDYRGFWEKASIWGTWRISAELHGGFRIWPQGRGEAFEKELEEAVDPARARPAPAAAKTAGAAAPKKA